MPQVTFYLLFLGQHVAPNNLGNLSHNGIVSLTLFEELSSCFRDVHHRRKLMLVAKNKYTSI